MSLGSNPHPLDDLAVYALDALEPDERAVIDAHLASCPACRAELHRHLDTLSQMATPEEPPAHLWGRIASQLPAPASRPTAERAGSTGAGEGAAVPPISPGPADVLPFDPERPRHAGGRTRRRDRARAPRTAWLTAAAAAAVLVVGAMVWSLRGDDGTSDIGDLAQAAAEDADSTVVRLTTGDGDPQARVVLTEEGTGYVLLDELPTLPAGRSYQLWKMNGSSTPISLGVIGDGSAEAAAVALPSDTTSFAISEEPAEGVTSPTGPIVADGEAA
jgi:anti-sigma-K factor RskA